MKTKITLFFIALILATNIHAQTADKPWGIGLQLGTNEYSGDLGNGFFNCSHGFYGFGGLYINRYINPSFDLGVLGTHGTYGYKKDSAHYFIGGKTDVVLMLSYKFNNGYILKEDCKWSPAIFAGHGIAVYNGKHINTDGIDYIISMGVGLKYSFNSWLAIQYMGLFNFTSGDKRDFISAKSNDHYLKHSLGVTFNLGCNNRDDDHDGVPNKRDKCPDTPKGVKVDKDGCPLDSDGDGVPDYLDKCPNTPKGAKVDKDGCPLVKQEVLDVFKEALTGITFETGKDVITPASYPILDKVVKVMQDNPDYKLEINGHTDNVGDPAMNKTLSQNRANAVMKYLTDKGVAASRMTAIGHGDTQPVADNKTPEGRAQNRRVEFKVNF